MREALKLALEALEDRSSLMKWQEARDAVKEALAQPEPEPVAYLDEGLGAFYWAKDYKKHVGFKPLYTTPPQRTEQEQQIETLKRCLFQMQEAAKDLVEQAKSLTPPQRTWVGLTDEEMRKICGSVPAMREAVREAEAKLKEKNT